MTPAPSITSSPDLSSPQITTPIDATQVTSPHMPPIVSATPPDPSPMSIPPDPSSVSTTVSNESALTVSLISHSSPQIPLHSLPPHSHMEEPNFTWGTIDGISFSNAINSAYYKVIHWKHNLFSIPWGRAGTSFISELASLFRAHGEKSSLESVSLHAAMVMPALLLQKPHACSKPKDYQKCLESHLENWKNGDIEALLHEGRTIQSRFRPLPTNINDKQKRMTKKFAKFMRQGKVKAALRLLDSHIKGGVLQLNITIQVNSKTQTVREALLEKHPDGQPAHSDTLLQPPTRIPDVHPVLFDHLDGEMIRRSALQTDGSAGPSGADSRCWRRMCTSIKKATIKLCNSIALVARCIFTTLVTLLVSHP